jgi:hypothetical protein
MTWLAHAGPDASRGGAAGSGAVVLAGPGVAPLIPQEIIGNGHDLQILIQHSPVPLAGRKGYRECPHSSSPLSCRQS